MREVFDDTFYWVAIINPADPDFQSAIDVGRSLVDARLVTTDEVLIEVLTFFAATGRHVRSRVVTVVRELLASAEVEVVMQSRESLLAGLKLYEARPDKEYSGVDSISMAVMKERGITEILTHDHHFAQEGFVLLL